MAFEYNHYYELKNSSTGKYVNLTGTHTSGVVNNGETVNLYARTNNIDQHWALEKFDSAGNVRIVLERGGGWYALNRHSSNNNCIVWHQSTADASDTVITMVPATNASEYYLKLRDRSLYLTASGSSLKWLAYTGSTTQRFSLVEPLSSGGTPSGQYTYPTVCRKCSQGYVPNSPNSSDGHLGLDIRDKETDHGVYAFADGIVAYTQRVTDHAQGSDMWTMGNCIAINHYNPMSSRPGSYARTIYMHLADAPAVKPGAAVSKGQRIGTIGTTGKSTANHLHFCVSAGDSSSLRPGETNWISISNLPHFDPMTVLPEYYIG